MYSGKSVAVHSYDYKFLKLYNNESVKINNEFRNKTFSIFQPIHLEHLDSSVVPFVWIMHWEPFATHGILSLILLAADDGRGRK